jgi:hypothetical protein
MSPQHVIVQESTWIDCVNCIGEVSKSYVWFNLQVSTHASEDLLS